MIHKDRIRHLIATPPESGKYVLYWMQQAQRIKYNHALCYAIEKANGIGLPLVVCFVLTPDFPEANLRHYVFMLEGIADVQKSLQKLGIVFVVKIGSMTDSVLSIAKEAAWVVTDVGYLRVQRQWRKQVSGKLRCPFTEIETDVTVPVMIASNKEEIGARTLRPRIMRQLDAYLDPVILPEYQRKKEPRPVQPSALIDPVKLAGQVAYDKNILPVKNILGGPAEAGDLLKRFISKKLARYHVLARDPTADCRSGLSAYLHFGQISPIHIVREVRESEAPDAAKAAFIDQAVIRRDLAVNFIFYNTAYDQYEGAAPPWAKQTFDKHRIDKRPYVYSFEALEAGETHDPYWNAAQMEMMKTGAMHNYMRMYWGKKIIEWRRDPEEAYEAMLTLNNRYELDGRDANGFAGVAWCFGRHDRPWQERAIFVTVRYMNAAGLKRKFLIDEYVKRIGEI